MSLQLRFPWASASGLFTEGCPPSLLTTSYSIVASVSGGRDSTALILHLAEHGVAFSAIHMDTGWEADATMDYIHGPLATLVQSLTGYPLTILRDEVALKPEQEAAALRVEAVLGFRSTMVRRTIAKGMFSSRVRRFCTQALKIFPSRDHYHTLNEMTGRVQVNAQGIRAAESTARSKYPCWEPYDGDCAIWRPLLRWAAADVQEIHRRFGVAMNPLYAMGASRVGCWPCIFARKAELRVIAETDPTRVEAIRLLEYEVGMLATIRAEARGDTLAHKPGMFQSMYQPGRDAKVPHNGWPIDQTLDWAHTETRADLAVFKKRYGLGKGREVDTDPVQEGCGRLSACDLP